MRSKSRATESVTTHGSSLFTDNIVEEVLEKGDELQHTFVRSLIASIVSYTPHRDSEFHWLAFR